MRTLTDRTRQVLLYEAGGLIAISPLFAAVAGITTGDSMALLAVLSALALGWTGAFNSAFDHLETRWTGRSADRRPALLRVLQALLLEAGSTAATTPVIAVWTGVSWQTALAEDIGLTLAYTVYAFFYGIAYDRMFPIRVEIRHG